MPKWLHDKLKKTGKGKGFSGDKLKQYVYGAMENLKKRKKKGKRSKLAKPGK